ncbi:ABC transporter permease [Candidatus Sumerlaeota bacterium]|nr:ABC transporter permease [Candidatus Sumerlaeota bacterium]
MEKQLWERRRLLWMFVRREIQTRYAGSMMGVFWSVINPLIMLAIYVTVIGFFLGGGRFGGGEGSGSEWFAIFLCCGLLPWNCISEALTGAANSVTNNASLIKRAVFPVSILPAQALAGAFINFLITLGLFLLILAGFQIFAHTHYLNLFVLCLPLAMALQFALLFGLCYLAATLQVYFRDTIQILTAALMIGFWATPIIYDIEALRKIEHLQGAFLNAFSVWCAVNPAAHLLGIYQDIISKQQPPSLVSVIYLLVLSGAFYATGKYLFTRSQEHFPDVV